MCLRLFSFWHLQYGEYTFANLYIQQTKAYSLRRINRVVEVEVEDRSAVGTGWEVASALFGRKLFFLTSFCSFLALVCVGLIALLAEQTINVFKNQVRLEVVMCVDFFVYAHAYLSFQTTNERVNASRYPWMVDKNGKPNNRYAICIYHIYVYVYPLKIRTYVRFNRGYITNILEFFRLCGYGVDYYEVFTLDDRDGAQLSNDSLMNSSITNKLHDKSAVGVGSIDQNRRACDDHDGCDHSHDHGHSHGHNHNYVSDV